MGAIQGGWNTANGITDTGTGMINGFIWAGNQVASLFGAQRGDYVSGLGDWSRDMAVSENRASHEASKKLGATGVLMLATMGGAAALPGASLTVPSFAVSPSGVVALGTTEIAISNGAIVGASGIGSMALSQCWGTRVPKAVQGSET